MSPSEQFLRLFVALAVPPDIRQELARVQRELRQTLRDPASLRWTRPEQFHLTLRFLGDVRADAVESLIFRLTEACARYGPVMLRAEGLGCFPDTRHPRVLWLGSQDESGHLHRLQQEVEVAAGAVVARPAENRFQGHLTLARVRAGGRVPGTGLAAALTAAAGRVFGRWTVLEVELVRSELLPTGSRHTARARIPLTGSAVPPTTSRL